MTNPTKAALCEIEGRAAEMLNQLVGPHSDTALRVATDWLKQEHRLALSQPSPASSTAGEPDHIADAGKMVETHPNTDQGVTAGSIGEQAAAIRVALYRAVPNMPSYPAGIVEPVLEQFRLSSTAALEAEVKRWHDAYCIAHDQAMSNGEAYQVAAAEIAFLKQRLESAEAMARLVTEYDHDRGCGGRCYSCECGYDERVGDAATAFLQEQEKQNG